MIEFTWLVAIGFWIVLLIYGLWSLWQARKKLITQNQEEIDVLEKHVVESIRKSEDQTLSTQRLSSRPWIAARMTELMIKYPDLTQEQAYMLTIQQEVNNDHDD